MEFKKNDLPKQIYGDRGNVLYQLSEHFNTTRDKAAAILEYLIQEGVVISHAPLLDGSVDEYAYNPNYDWDKVEEPKYKKFRFLVLASFISNKVPRHAQSIVEWDKDQLDDLTSIVIDALKSNGDVIDNDWIQIGNLIEIGYPVEVE